MAYCNGRGKSSYGDPNHFLDQAVNVYFMCKFDIGTWGIYSFPHSQIFNHLTVWYKRWCWHCLLLHGKGSPLHRHRLSSVNVNVRITVWRKVDDAWPSVPKNLTCLWHATYCYIRGGTPVTPPQFYIKVSDTRLQYDITVCITVYRVTQPAQQRHKYDIGCIWLCRSKDEIGDKRFQRVHVWCWCWFRASLIVHLLRTGFDFLGLENHIIWSLPMSVCFYFYRNASYDVSSKQKKKFQQEKKC